MNCEVHATYYCTSVLVPFWSVFYPAGQWVAFAPINAYCIALLALTCLATPPRLVSPRLAGFGLIAYRTGSPYSLAFEMRAVRISSSYQLPLYIYRPPKPVPDFQSSSFPVLGIRATPTLRSLNQPTWQCLAHPFVSGSPS